MWRRGGRLRRGGGAFRLGPAVVCGLSSGRGVGTGAFWLGPVVWVRVVAGVRGAPPAGRGYGCVSARAGRRVRVVAGVRGAPPAGRRYGCVSARAGRRVRVVAGVRGTPPAGRGYGCVSARAGRRVRVVAGVRSGARARDCMIYGATLPDRWFRRPCATNHALRPGHDPCAPPFTARHGLARPCAGAGGRGHRAAPDPYPHQVGGLRGPTGGRGSGAWEVRVRILKRDVWRADARTNDWAESRRTGVRGCPPGKHSMPSGHVPPEPPAPGPATTTATRRPPPMHR